MLRLGGRLDNAGAGSVWGRAIELASDAAGQSLVVDGRDVDYCDGAGAVLLSELERRQRSAGGTYRLDGLAEDSVRLVGKVAPTDRSTIETDAGGRKRPPLPARVGRAAFDLAAGVREVLVFTGFGAFLLRR